MPCLNGHFPGSLSQSQSQLPHLSSHSCQQPWGAMQGRLTQIQGFGDDLTRDGVRRLTRRFGWSATQLQAPRNLSGLPAWASGWFSVFVRGKGQALGPCACLTKDREMAKDFLQISFLAVLSLLPSEGRADGTPWCNSSPGSPYPSPGCWEMLLIKRLRATELERKHSHHVIGDLQAGKFSAAQRGGRLGQPPWLGLRDEIG